MYCFTVTNSMAECDLSSSVADQGVSSGCSGFLPQSKDMHGRLIGISKLSIVYDCTHGRDTADTTQSTTPTELQQSIEALYLSVRQLKQNLYRQNDSSKIHHYLQRKLAEDKKLLLEEIYKYNSVVESTKAIDFAMQTQSNPVWPWEVHVSAKLAVKKKMHDQVMLMLRLEKSILVLEMAQHCTWLQNLAVVLNKKVAEEDLICTKDLPVAFAFAIY
ncbi:hypothetical protein QTP70_031466 [Hemibagrus guttatus]|uniref:Uncharacterized protein n=1 Tax=Hemibagrus guttatus TaxID=175788 RepID=A0AAE0QPK9_9TELE|nr:hypothetical protein QTP70_031466 [Hemibagrus guttatus]